MATKLISVRINKKLLKMVEARAKVDDMTVSTIINNSLELYITTFDETNLTILEKNYLATSLLYQYVTLGGTKFKENREQIIEATKESMRTSRSIR